MKNNYIRLGIVLVVFTVVSCEKLNQIVMIEPSFSLKSGMEYLPFIENDTTVFFCVNNNDDLVEVKPHFIGINVDFDGVRIKSDSTILDLSDFTIPHELTFKYEDGRVQVKKLVLFDLPVIIVNTPDLKPILSKIERKEGCQVGIVYEGENKIDTLGLAGIKGRGNSTWEQPKKPYNIKFDSKQSFWGLGKSKHWLLLSNPKYDRTQLHNDVAFEIARMTDFPWVPTGSYVELILNGEHKGLYYFCEKIRVAKDRINISEINPEDNEGDALTGGYILEAEINFQKNNVFQTEFFSRTGENDAYPLVWNVDTPDEDITPEQFAYIKNKLNRLEEKLADKSNLNGGAFWNELDLESLINWYLVENLCLNEEASRSKNLILYKDRDSSVAGGKFVVGPPWDLDAWTFGFTGTKKLYVGHNTWCFSSVLEDKDFSERLKEKWELYYGAWKEHIPSYIDSRYHLIRRSAMRNEQMWPEWSYACEYPDKSYNQMISDMKEAFIEQLEWMNDLIMGF